MVKEYKVVLCGKTGVGKTTIFRRLCGKLDLERSEAKSTMDHECKIRVKVEGEMVELQLWDTLGLEQHAQYTRSHFLLTHAVLIVYSATDKDSCNQAAELLPYAKIHAQGACFILVRNKIDLDSTFSEDDAMALLPKTHAFTMQFRTSALNGEGVKEMLEQIATHLVKEATPMKPIGPSLDSGGCCRNGMSCYSGKTGVVRLEFQDEEEKPRRRQRNCCSI